ncbi:uncharacterized protein cubi_02613 [Cryptosporidium ubiquitum]|uniref:Roadblock/LAMTOR2 domain-containing protein n=1 Tax=Cryptosporidium ubiquitum TaxID=857276 RepID=A0A1J4MGP3_9CRYT|nr:uncharacterized protein cubi_02613 [Cryptosporidium ubiquitum]OII73401.1 hypothetical protein cubi_02613 [Cryptosporidium ubiquitum]
MINSKRLNELLNREICESDEIKAIILVNKEGGIFSLGVNKESIEISQINHISSVLVSSFNEYKSNNQTIKDLYLESSNGKFIIGHTHFKNLFLIVWFEYNATIGKVHIKFNNINNALSG